MSKTSNAKLLSAARTVPCIEVLDGPPPAKAKRCAGPYYPDQGEKLVATLTGLARREPYLVAVDELGHVNLYRRARK